MYDTEDAVGTPILSLTDFNLVAFMEKQADAIGPDRWVPGDISEFALHCA